MNEYLDLPNEWLKADWDSLTANDGFRRGPFGGNLKKAFFVESGYAVYEQYAPINDDCTKFRYFIDKSKYLELESFNVLGGDSLISCSGTMGRITRVPQDAPEGVINQALLRIRLLNDYVYPDFFIKLFRSPDIQTSILTKSVGGAIQNLAAVKELKQIELPLPPLAEQKVIAEKLDTLLAEVETTKAKLESTLQTLKQFRQSVLASAVSGKLTENWRGVKECKGWEQVKLSRFITGIEAGKNLKCIETPPRENEFGIVKISAVTWGIYNEEESKTLPEDDLFIEARRILVGDFLISRANTIELLGNPVIVHQVNKNLMLSDKVLRLVMADEDKPWVNIFLRSHDGRKEIESRATGNQNSMRNIGQKALLDIDLPKVPAKEQTEIVRRVETLFAHADKTEQQVNQALARVNNLTQSILAKAFRGELTAQWRKDNPELISGENSAEALLAKIKAEREAAKEAAKASKKAKPKGKSKKA